MPSRMKTSRSDSEAPTASDLQRLAVDLLARREHSRLELYRKLSSRTPDSGLVDSVLDDLTDRGWQSDERYCTVFLRSRLNRGSGPLRLKQELRARGISDSVVATAFEELEADWFELALAVAQKKRSALRSDPKWKEKLYRFLTYRGFDSEQTRYAMETAEGQGDV